MKDEGKKRQSKMTTGFLLVDYEFVMVWNDFAVLHGSFFRHAR